MFEINRKLILFTDDTRHFILKNNQPRLGLMELVIADRSARSGDRSIRCGDRSDRDRYRSDRARDRSERAGDRSDGARDRSKN